MPTAIIYVRVSDSRQVDNTSLDSQETVCREWCRTNGLEVSRVFVERGESAKSADRTQFQAMFRYLAQAGKGSVSHVIVYKFDRFSRNVEDGAVYRLELRKLGIALRSATEATDDSPAGKFLTTMLSAAGQFDNDTRAERTLTGMKNRLDSGRWQWPAPTGYNSGSKSGPSLVIDPVRGPLIARLFELVATGEHSKASALAAVTALGLRSRKGVPLTQETIRKVLINPLYAGEIFIKTWSKSVKGDYDPLVSRSVFDRVQSILSERAPAQVPHVAERDDFPLRGLILCPDCLKPVTASLSTGKLGNKFPYYFCHRAKGHISVRAETVETAFIELLERLTPKPEQMELIERVFRSAWKGRAQTAVADAAALRRELAKQEARKERVLGQMADGVLSAEDFASLHKPTVKAIADLRERLDFAESEVLDLDSAIEYLTHLLWNTSLVWQTSDLQGKKRIQRRMFPEGLPYGGRGVDGFGTPVTHSIYTLLAGDLVDEETLVAPQGFEPRSSESESLVLPLNEGATG
jgi:site-specific DNA recombinase